MQRLEIGKLYDPNRNYYSEGTIFNIKGTQLVLRLAYYHPTAEEIQEIRKGTFQANLLEKDNIIFLLAKFGSGNWMDAPFSAHLCKNLRLLDLEEGKGYALNIFLVDASDGILKAMRRIRLQPEFSKALKRMIEKQKKTSFNKEIYKKSLIKVFNYYSTAELVKLSDYTN